MALYKTLYKPLPKTSSLLQSKSILANIGIV